MSAEQDKELSVATDGSRLSVEPQERLKQMRNYVRSAIEMGTTTKHTQLLAECIDLANVLFEENARLEKHNEGLVSQWRELGKTERVLEAAQDVRENSKQAIGMEDPWGSQGPPILVGASDWFRLADAVDNLHRQEPRSSGDTKERSED